MSRKAGLLAVGFYHTQKGYVIHLEEMADHHLVNALLKALATEEGDGVTQPLAAEVNRRGLRRQAEDEARRRAA